MTTATDMIEKHINQPTGQIGYKELMSELNASGVDPEQDWDNESTTWTFDDESAIRVSGRDVQVFGVMPNTNQVDWYFAGFTV